MGFGSLGISELLVIFVIVLVFFGPKRMPEVARSLGSAMREFRRSLNQIQRELEEADPTRELRRETKDILSRLPEEVRPGAGGTNRPRSPVSPGHPASGAGRRPVTGPESSPSAAARTDPDVATESSAPATEPAAATEPSAVKERASDSPPDQDSTEAAEPRPEAAEPRPEPAEPRPDVTDPKAGNGSG